MRTAAIVFLGYAAIPVILVIAFIFGRYNQERTRRTIKPLRLSTSWILVACAWIIWATSTTLRTPALLIALGMTFGALGDLADDDRQHDDGSYPAEPIEGLHACNPGIRSAFWFHFVL